MGLLAPLLEIQEIDRACDRLRDQRRDLPERAQRAKVEARIAATDTTHAELQARRAEIDRVEHEVAEQVAGVAARAKGVEDTLYGGTVTAARDLAALQEEIEAIRAEQSVLEERELELLEEIDGVEGEMAENRGERAAIEAELADVAKALQAAEALIDAELEALGRDKASRADGLPRPVLDTYEDLRGHERLGGVAAALFTEKGCGGCRMALPRLEMQVMRDQPEDAVLRCENCSRLLVR